jgi:hypothetical protein
MLELGPVIGIIFSIGGPVAIAIVAIVLSFRSKKKQYEAMLKALELGKSEEEVKNLFIGNKRVGDGMGFLRGGIVVIGTGIGLAGMGMVLNVYHIYAPAVFLIILGLALAIVYFVTKPKKEEEK